MNIFTYMFLGFIQGITESIPVSSSGHLILVNSLLGAGKLNDLNFEIFTNFGSFIAITIFYWNEIIKIFRDFFCYVGTKKEIYKTNYNYAWLIVIGTIPAGLAGFIFKDFIESITSAKFVGLLLIITAILLLLVKNINGNKEKKDMTIKDAIVIGLFHVIGLLPGISRSGATLVGGLTRKLDSETAFNYSFMLYLPISVAAMLLSIIDLINDGLTNELIIPYIISMIISGIFTYLTIGLFKKIINKGKLYYFAYYCIVVGLLAILFL